MVDGHPRNIMRTMQHLSERLKKSGPFWQGTQNAHKTLQQAHAYLLGTLPQELAGYEAMWSRLMGALHHLKPLPVGDPFGKAFDQYLASRQSYVSAAVYDVNTHQLYLYNPRARFDTASIVKVTILSTLLWQSQKMGRPLSAQQQALAVPMIEESNDNDASALWAAAGSAAGIQKFLNAAGLRNVTPGPDGMWGLTLTTAADQVQLMKIVSFPNTLLTPASQQYLLNLMEHVIGWEAWGISAGPPDSATVALKNGWLPIGTDDWEINSMGQVNGSGRHYLIAVLTRDNPTEEYGIQTIQHISTLVWQSQQD